MSKKAIIIAVLAVIVIAGGIAIADMSSNPKAEEPSGVTATSTDSAATYSMSEVAKHGDAKSCWTVVNGGVYDVTLWIDQHPGGRGAILSLCGRDGTTAFGAQHGGERNPARELAGFRIGELAQ